MRVAKSGPQMFTLASVERTPRHECQRMRTVAHTDEVNRHILSSGRCPHIVAENSSPVAPSWSAEDALSYFAEPATIPFTTMCVCAHGTIRLSTSAAWASYKLIYAIRARRLGREKCWGAIIESMEGTGEGAVVRHHAPQIQAHPLPESRTPWRAESIAVAIYRSRPHLSQ